MKKIICILLLITTIGCRKTNSQVVVFDPVAFDEMVMQGYAMYQQLENQIREIQYLYEFVQMQIRSIEKLDPDSYFDLRNYVIGRVNGIESLAYRIRNIHLRVGTAEPSTQVGDINWNYETYSLGDVLPTNEEIVNWFETLADAQENNNTQQYNNTLNDIADRERRIRQFLSERSQEAVALAEESRQYQIDSTTRLQDLLDQVEGNESITAQLQVGNQLTMQMNLTMLELLNSLSSMNSMYAANSLTRAFDDYRLLVPQMQEPGSAGMENLSDDFDEYVRNKDENVFDPMEIFNRE